MVLGFGVSPEGNQRSKDGHIDDFRKGSGEKEGRKKWSVGGLKEDKDKKERNTDKARDEEKFRTINVVALFLKDDKRGPD